MRDWRAGQRTDVLRAAAKREGKKPEPGTFADDVVTYLKAVKSMPTYAERAQHLQHWIAVLGKDRKRDTITSDEVRAALQQWRINGKPVRTHARDPITKKAVIKIGEKRGPLSESACNHRRTALMHLFTVLDGKSAANPVKDVPKFRQPDPEPRGVPMAIVRKVLAKMPAGPTKARASVMAWTGLPQATLKQIRAEDVHWQDKSVYVPRRRKGKGTTNRIMPLLPEAIQAFKLMKRHAAWGKFSTSSLNHAVTKACTLAGVPVIRAYDLRHSFGTAAYKASGDIHAVQNALGHSDPKLTARYALGAANVRVRSMLKAMQTRKVTSKVTKKRKRGKKR